MLARANEEFKQAHKKRKYSELIGSSEDDEEEMRRYIGTKSVKLCTSDGEELPRTNGGNLTNLSAFIHPTFLSSGIYGVEKEDDVQNCTPNFSQSHDECTHEDDVAKEHAEEHPSDKRNSIGSQGECEETKEEDLEEN